MADNVVGQAKVKLGLDAEQFKKGLKDSERELNAFGTIAKKAFGAVAIGLTAKQTIKYIGESVEAFRQEQIAINTLNQALMNSGTYTYEYSQSIQKLAQDIQMFSNYGNEATIKAVAMGQAMAGNVKFTNEAIKAVVDFAAAMNMDLDSAFRLVGKSIGSNTNALARYGIELDKGMSKEQKLAVLTEKLGNSFGGTAEKTANASIQLKNALGEVSKAIGAIFNPAVEASQKLIVKWAISLADFINKARILNTEINNLKLDELDTKYEHLKKQRDAYINSLKTEKNLNMRAHTEELLRDVNKDIQAIEARTNALKEEEKVKAQASKSTKQVTDTQVSGTNKALEEYQKFIDSFKEATNDYEATLKAREYVQKTLGISAISDDYNNALSAYKEYYKQILTITQSGASNKAELLRMNETRLQQELQNIALTKTDETERKQWELIRNYQDEMMKIENDVRARDEAGGFLGSFGTGYQERLNILRWYYQEYDKITNTHFTDTQAKLDAYNQLTLLKDRKMLELQGEIWRERGQEIVGIFENTFSQMLTNYGNFSDNMKQLALNLIQYLLKEELSYMMKSIEYEKIRVATISALRSLIGGIGGFFGNLFGINHSGHLYVPSQKYHSGGMAADQTEHFALIKNNERVLSPAETASYNNNEQQGGSNYIVYAPVVRAMDSKDVANWFNENKNQVISIVSQGIKNNTQGLRTQVQGV